MVPIKDLRIRSEGTYYKAYVKGQDGLHYVINVNKGRCRCVEDRRIMRIRRQVKERHVNHLWEEAQNKLKNYGGKTPWETMEVKEEVKPWPWNDNGEVLDPRKYIGRCAFIDLSMTGIGEESDGLDSSEDDGDDEEQKSTMISKETVSQTPNGMDSVSLCIDCV